MTGLGLPVLKASMTLAVMLAFTPTLELIKVNRGRKGGESKRDGGGG